MNYTTIRISVKTHAILVKRAKKNRRTLIAELDEILKESRSKRLPVAQPQGIVVSSEINDFLELFSIVNPTYKTLFARKVERVAAERMLKIHTLDWWKEFMSIYEQKIGEKYCPKATTATQMEAKLGAILAYGFSEKKHRGAIIV